jgi:PAS domain S-box-containing protein
MLNSEIEKRSNERLKTLHGRKKKYERLLSSSNKQKQPDDSDNAQQERYKTLIENIPCAVYSAYPGKTGPTTFISKKWEDWTGYSPDELYRDPEVWPKCIHPDDREKAVNAYSRACQDKLPYNLEYRIVHKETGQVLYVRDQGHLSEDTKGTVIRVDGIITDISECKHAEERIHKNNAKFRNFLDNLGDIAYEADTSGNITYANKMAEKITGILLKDIIGKPFLPLFTEESQQIAINVYERTLNGESAEYELTLKNGRICHFKNEPLRDENGEITGVFGIARDVTERKRVERALQESQKQFKNLFNNALLGLYKTTPDGRILMANPTLVRMLGYDSFEELALRNLEDEGYHPEYPRSAFKERIRHEGKVIGLESAWKRSDGTTLYVRESAQAICDESGKILYYQGTVEDITKRMKAEEALRKAHDELEIRVQERTAELQQANEALSKRELTLNLALQVAQLGHWDWNIPTGEVICSDEIYHMFGVESEQFQFTYERFFEFVHPSDRESVSTEIQLALREDKLLDMEFRIFRTDGQERILHCRAASAKKQNGEPLRMIGTTQDVTEQKQADREIRERAKIIDSTTDSVIKTNRDGIVTMWNRGAERMFGYAAEQMIGQPIDILYPEQEQDKLAEMIEVLSRGEEITTTEVTCVHKNGSPVELALSVLPFKDDSGNVIDFVGISKDITDRKKAREALQESENRYRTVIENAGEGIVVAQDGMLRFVNSQHTSVTGRSQEESMSRPFVEFVHPDDRQRVAEAHAERLRGGQVPSVSEFRIIDKSGRIRWLENNGVLIEWNGKPASLNFLRDITARKKAEEALREHEEMIRALVETSCDWIWSIDLNSVHTYCNPAVEQILGYSPDELVGKRSLDLLHDDDRVKVEANLPIWIDEKRGWSNLMLRWKHKDGTYRYLESNAVPILSSENELIGFRGVDRDITDRKRAEDVLTETTGLLETIFAHTHILIAYLDSQFNFVRVNHAYAQTDGHEPAFFVGRNHFELFPNAENEVIFREVVESGMPYFAEAKPFEYTELPERGITYWDWSLIPIKEQDGVVSGLVLTLADVTERKQAEEALRESEEKFRSLAEQSPNMIFINKRGRIVYVNNKCEEVIGYKREELCSENFDFRSLIAPESLDLIKEKFAQHLRGQEVQPYDYSIIKKNGERIEAINASKLIQYEGQTAILGIVTDITGRKRAEQALRESEERLKILFESAPDAIYLADSEGRFVDGNRAAENLIGYAREDIIGKKVADVDLLSAEQLSRAQTNLKKVIAGELSGPNEYTVKRRDGTYVSIEVRNFPVKIGGKILSLGIARDITEHKRTEQELLEHQDKLKSLASQLSLTEERERYRLATDLHDQISQSLVISKIKLDQLRRSSGSDELDEPLEDISNCLGRVIDDTRALTFDLSYPILYELGFEAAVGEWLIEQIQEKHRIETEFKDDGLPKPLDDDICVLLFRNVREILINVVKHAQASKVRVSIRKIDDNIQVSVEDNGIGFDPLEVTKKATKRAEFGLFSIRERLEQLSGIIVIESKPGSGSKITMRAPLKYKNSTDRMSK